MGILVLGDMLAPLSFFWESIAGLSFAIRTSLLMPPSLPCMSIVFICLGTTLITKRKKERLRKGRGEQGVLWEMCKW